MVNRRGHASDVGICKRLGGARSVNSNSTSDSQNGFDALLLVGAVMARSGDDANQTLHICSCETSHPKP